MKQKNKIFESGITLIALVITIIVLLILAGVTINMLTGENGILKQATNAKDVSEKSEFEEQVRLSVIASKMNNSARINLDELDTELKKISGVTEKNINKQGENGKLPWIVTKGKNSVTIQPEENTDEKNSSEDKGDVEEGWVNEPKLITGMTPIYWDENNTEIIVTESNKDKWYNYKQKRWANAKTEDGSYWVWIPRYEYSIDSNTKKINIKFIKTTQTTVDDNYTYIHPAFRNGTLTNFQNGEWDEEIPGFWVAKYSAGFQSCSTDINGNNINETDTIKYSTSKYTGFSNSCKTNALGQNLTEEGNEKISYPVFKPLTYSYNNISVGDCYTISQEIDSAVSFYGLSGYNNSSHLMKNSEWGAVVYLTQSSYGRNGTEVTINSRNLSDLDSKLIYTVTGYAGNTALGTDASSTSDMSRSI